MYTQNSRKRPPRDAAKTKQETTAAPDASTPRRRHNHDVDDEPYYDRSLDHVARVRAAKEAAQRRMEEFGDISEYDVTIIHGQLKDEPEREPQLSLAFEHIRGVSAEFFTDDDGRLHPLLTAFPISLSDRERPASCSVRFVFIDEGLSGAAKFLRYLDAVEPLLRAVGRFEVIYVANSESVFPSVKSAFWSRFSHTSTRGPGLFGGDFRAARAPSRSPLDPTFTTVLFRHSYPAIQRSKGVGSERVRSAGEVRADK